MQAATSSQYGTPHEVVRISTVQNPTPHEDQLLVRVHAATVNRTDCGHISGRPFVVRFATGIPRPKHSITGTDFAGIVEDIGRNVKKFKVGDRVWGFADLGLSSHAEYLTISETQPVAPIPESFSYEQAAASPEGAHYAYNFLNKVPLQAGQKVLINGATGAIGSAMVQLCSYFGAIVTATCATPYLDKVRALGANRVIDFTREDFTHDHEKYHYIFDAVGKSTFGRCKPLLLPGGVYISSELGPGWQNPFLALITPVLGGKQVKFPFPSDILRSMRLVEEMIDKKAFTPLIDRIYPLDEVREAFRYVASGQKIGNVLLRIEQPNEKRS